MLAGLVLSYFAATLALASAMGEKQAQRALKLAPYHADALAGSALVLLQADHSRSTLDRSQALATRALSREPISVPALRALGLTASLRNDVSKARAYFTLVERLSRRDLTSQLWWIEYKVAQGDVAGALTYYDEALRTSSRAAGLLMPVLTQAVADPNIAAGITPFLANRPAYFRQFFIQAADTTPNMVPVATVGRKLLNRGDPDDQDLINRIILRFGRDKKYDEAWRMFAWARGGQSVANVVNGTLDQPTPFRLFNWDPTESDALTAEIAPRDHGGNGLYLIARVSRGVAARQLLRLPVGRYQLSAVVGDVPDAPIDRPTMGITCADRDGALLAPQPFPPSPTPGTALRAKFDVGPECRYQWLTLTASASSEDETRAWIDDISIRPIR